MDVRLVISSCKQSDVPRPLTAERFRAGKHTFTVESQGRKETYNLPDIPLGRWVDLVCRSRYSTNNDGCVQVWMNGREVVSYKGPLGDPNAKKAFYHKIGLYRDRMAEPMTIYFDNYTMGNSYDCLLYTSSTSRHCLSNAVKKPVNEPTRIAIPRNIARPSTLAVIVRSNFGGHTITPPRANSRPGLRSMAYAIPSVNCKTTQSCVTKRHSVPLRTVRSNLDMWPELEVGIGPLSSIIIP